MSEVTYTTRVTCRLCSGPLGNVVDFGMSALTSSFPAHGEMHTYAPMHLMQCATCKLLQLDSTVNPKLMYREGYGYASGINEQMVAHLTKLVDDVADRYDVMRGDPVLDIACNDGTLLKAWEKYGVDRHGVDPIASDVPGCKITKDYFTGGDIGRFKVITSVAMFYDLDDPIDFACKVASSLRDDGVWIVEVGYAGALLEGRWDGVCHEHLTYFGLTQLMHIGQVAGMYFARAELNESNGGSIRVHFTKRPYKGIIQGYGFLTDEIWWKPELLSDRIFKDCEAIRLVVSHFDVVDVLGASTKGNTILQAAGLNHNDIRYAVDRNPAKVGRVLPGTSIPIVGDDRPVDVSPDAYLMLPYHFKDSILKRHATDVKNGVKFILPLPKTRIL